MLLSPEQPIAGILAPLFALRTEDDLGIGDVAALRDLVDWAADSGFRLVQLLPINETGADNSPYNAISSVAIEPTTLELTPEALVDLEKADVAAVLSGVDCDALGGAVVDYRAVKAIKVGLLERAFARFCDTEWRRNTSRARKLRAFLKKESAWLEGYALFRVLMDENGVGELWDIWPEDQRTLESARLWLASQKAKRRKALESRVRFYEYVQWIAFTQWREMHGHAAARGVALMGDVPFGVSYYSADVFSRPDLFNLEWSGGAPPEPYFKDDAFTQKWGQNWGVPLYRWDVMEAEDYAWWRQRVAMVREIFHLFRIDHVLGFYRIFGFPWRPQENADYLALTEDEARARTGGELPHFVENADDTWERCERNRKNGDRRLRVLLEEVGEYRLIGEDLGTVPDYVRPNLTSLGIAGFKIPIWERKGDGWLIDGPDYQRLSVATYATHDHEPLRVLWERLEQEANEGGFEEQRKLAGFAGKGLAAAVPWSDDLHRALLKGLFGCNAWIAICMVTDLFGTSERFNVPGAFAESNWSRRLALPVTEWKQDPRLGALTDCVRGMLEASGRVPAN